jgi:methionyl-tRNA formyltransferase
MMKENKDIKFVYFGTSEFAVYVLEVLKENALTPSLIVTREDKPQGRGLELAPSPAKIWAQIHNVPVIEPKNLKEEQVTDRIRKEEADIFLVAAYGLLVPKEIFEMPPGKTLNVHPSLLPRLRGPSPIQSTILENEEPGVSIMLISEGLDEGPIIAQEKVTVPEWPPQEQILEELLARRGATLLGDLLLPWLSGDIQPKPQDETRATFCRKISKNDGLLDFSEDAQKNLLKVKALGARPGAFTYFNRKDGKKIRLSIKDAEIVGGKFTPTQVVPEGKKEMSWQDFLRGNS